MGRNILSNADIKNTNYYTYRCRSCWRLNDGRYCPEMSWHQSKRGRQQRPLRCKTL